MIKPLNPEELLRYDRQIRLPEVGEAGQEKLKASRVLVAGLGGLGSAAASYLAGAGVGRIGLLDDGRVDESDLHRQILYASTDIGWGKAVAARDRVQAMNPLIAAVALEERLDATNARWILQDYDFVCDCTDNFEARLIINETCHDLKLPFCHGGIDGHKGQLTTIHSAAGTPCYRCLYPSYSVPDLPGSGEPSGILGPVPGVIGCLQAMEAMKHLLDLGDLLHARLLVLDLMTGRVKALSYEKNPACPVCG